MWTQFSHNIIKYRLVLLVLLGIVTIFMGYKAQQVKWSYDFAKVIPLHNPEMQAFLEFRDLFGEDGNVIAIGVQDSALFTPLNFRRFGYLADEIGTLDGVVQVLSLPRILKLEKDNELRKFNLVPLFDSIPDNQEQFDKLLNLALEQKFYSGQLINEQNGAVLMLITLDAEVLNSEKRIHLTEDVIQIGKMFTAATGIEVHYAGLPFVRSIVAGKVKQEMLIFILFSVLITGAIMFAFFRSWTAVIFPMIIIGIVVVWVMGTLVLLNYKITLLVGVIPSIIVVIGIPNSIYLLNKYHSEFREHGKKIMAISRVIRSIGLVTFITNSTTAVGFLVLGFTEIKILKEFGIVAGLNIMATFIVSIILLPSLFYYLPEPSRRHLKHLKFRLIDLILTKFNLIVHNYRYPVFGMTALIVLLSVVGFSRIQSISYMVDDIPAKSQVRTDLGFFEKNFGGIMPMEIVVDTKKPRGVLDIKNLERINRFEMMLDSQSYLSKPISIVSLIKASRQAYYNQNPDRYDLPNRRDRSFILRYFRNASEDQPMLNSFMDSTGRKMRISLQVADVGSEKMDSLLSNILIPAKDRIFAGSDIGVKITGTTPLFIHGNKYLIENLQLSFLLAFGIIAIIMALLFANLRMIILSLIPNVIPLVMTAGFMGYFQIPLKPSTAIVFSIAFGISVDYSIHFLAKYRQELFSNRFFVPAAVTKAMIEIGPSMIYTSIVLFAGFIIFSISDFGGTVALGLLTSTTLFVSMLTNLIVLPSLLLTFDDGKRSKDNHPLIDKYDSVDARTEPDYGSQRKKAADLQI